jgi:hypothetical protein
VHNLFAFVRFVPVKSATEHRRISSPQYDLPELPR